MSVENLSDIFFGNYKKFLDKYAVIFNDGETVKKSTYEQLAIECCKVSKCLQGSCAQGFVGIFMQKDLALPAVILGILHSNLPFVCIDVKVSEYKILHVLEYLNVKWVFSDSTCHHAKKILANHGIESKNIDLYEDTYMLWHVNVNFGLEGKLLPVLTTLKLAYAIQTSGSTGKPKVIRVPHQSILPNILDLCEILHVNQTDVVFWGSPLTFDPSIVELFLPLAYGATLLVVPSSVRVSPLALLEVLFPISEKAYAGTSVLQITPSSFSRWSIHDIQTRILSKTTTLKKLLLGGEPCPSMAILNYWRGVGNVTEVFNIYGVTEVSCWATVERVTLSSKLNFIDQTDAKVKCMLDIPLGSPLSKTVLQVRNDLGCIISCGRGELFIGSSERICLVNEEIFDELSPPVFRATGDIVEFDKQHKEIKYIGRKNRIIKRWGHRVCLNEIEVVLSGHPDVERCCCVWIQAKNILAAAVVWKEHEECQSFRLFCVQHLHKTEVPDATVSVNSLPLTNHGKIDYENLQVIVLNKNLQNVTYNEKTSSLQIVQAWKNILGQEPSPLENFMSSGGNSLLAVQLTSEIEKVFGESIRSVVMSMLLANSSFVDIQNYLLSPGHSEGRVKCDVDSQCAPQSVSLVMNTSSEDECSNEIEIKDDVEQPSVTENVHSFSNKRNVPFHSPQILKPRKIDFPIGNTNFEERHSLQVSSYEDKLTVVCCRGHIIKKEVWSDKWTFNQEDRISLLLNWKFDMHKCVDASPCYLKYAKKSWVVVGSHSHLLVVLESFTGEIISKCELPDRIESSICPSLCGNYGIVGCYDGHIYCISLHSGEIMWSFHTGDIVKSSPSLCLGNTAVVVGSYDSNIYCINVKNGKLIWKNSPSSASIYANPCISNSGMIYIASLDGTCAAVCEKTGQSVWKTKVSSPVFSSPALVQSATAVIFAEVVGIVHGFSASKGNRIWQFKANGNIFSSFSTLCFSHHCYELLVFGSHDKNVYCIKWIDHNNVSLLWKKELESAVFATPFIYAADNRSSDYSASCIKTTCIMAAATKGLLYALNAEDGSIKTVCSLGNEIFSSPIVCESQIFVGCRDNYLHSFSFVKQ